MRKALPILGLLLMGLAPQTASAEERELTLYSPPIRTLPYVHDTHYVPLQANGTEAPDRPGYVTGIKEQVLVDSKDPDARPLSNARMMIHHFLYFAPGRVDDAEGSCWSGAGFLSGRGEEHPTGNFSRMTTPESRARYGITNRRADGTAPDWRLIAMVMNHVKKPKTVYVRTRVYYTEAPREPVYPTVVGCRPFDEGFTGMAYDVEGGGGRGAEHVDQSTWTSPINGRILLAASHQHGGGKYQLLTSDTCRRHMYKGNVYHGTKDHIYNTIRPILHEPGPIANGTLQSRQGVPITKGEVLRRTAVHDNSNLHVAAMGFWVLHIVRDESVGECDPLPSDIRDVRKPKRYDRTPNFGLKVPQLDPPTGPFEPFTGGLLSVRDNFFRPGKIEAAVGQDITWSFDGRNPHTVTVANGPRGFSSLYTGIRQGQFTFTPTVPGTYRMTCLVHPTTMGQTIKVR